MDDLTGFLADSMRQIQRDAAQALAATPTDQDAGVFVIPVVVLEGKEIELEPISFYRRAAEVPGG